MATLTCLTLIFTGLLLAARADAGPTPDPAPTRADLRELRWNVVRTRERKCWNVPPFRRGVRDIPLRGIPSLMEHWHRRLNRARAAANRCVPTSPAAIIRYVFPAATENAALRVAYCETGGTLNPRALNASSGAAGLFQLMPFHWQGKFDPFNPLANTLFAYRLSHAGYDWSAWVCRP